MDVVKPTLVDEVALIIAHHRYTQLLENKVGPMHAADIMTTNVISVQAGSEVSEIAGIL